VGNEQLDAGILLASVLSRLLVSERETCLVLAEVTTKPRTQPFSFLSSDGNEALAILPVCIHLRES
jgi:hypothetical protein